MEMDCTEREERFVGAEWGGEEGGEKPQAPLLPDDQANQEDHVPDAEPMPEPGLI